MPGARRSQRRNRSTREAPGSSRAEKKRQQSTPEPSAPDRVIVGEIRKPWGRVGDILATLYAGNESGLRPGMTLFVNGRPAEVLSIHDGGRGGTVLTLSTIRNPGEAEATRGAILEIATDDLPELPEDFYYHFELLGMTVTSESGETIGELCEVIETGANDVYAVRPEGKNVKEILIPAIQGVILKIDRESGTVIVDLPGGLT